MVKEEEGGGAGAPTQGLPIHGETNTGGGGVCTITHVPATVAEGWKWYRDGACYLLGAVGYE